MSKILIVVPIKPTLNKELKQIATKRAEMLLTNNPDHEIALMIDYHPVELLPTDCRPWSKVTRARNHILNTTRFDCYDYLLWIDADVIDYPLDMPTQLIACNPDGISAPMVYVEDTRRFYDWTAFIIKGRSHIQPTNRNKVKGRNLQPEPPYWPVEPEAQIVEMDVVGTVTMVPVEVYTRSNVRYEDHPAFTDHYPICEEARKQGRKVVVNRNVNAFHADLPKYGEQWH